MSVIGTRTKTSELHTLPSFLYIRKRRIIRAARRAKHNALLFFAAQHFGFSFRWKSIINETKIISPA
jgi:hypothetical protein